MATSECVTYVLPGQLVVPALVQISYGLCPVLELGPRHVEEAAGVLREDVLPGNVPVLLAQLGDELGGVVREGVDALHEASVDLDLLQLVAVRHVAVAVELVDQCGYAVVEELALLLPLRLLTAAAGGARLAVEAGRRGVVGCGHGGQVRLGIAIEAADDYIVLRRTGKGRSCTEIAWFEKDVPTTRGSSAVVR